MMHTEKRRLPLLQDDVLATEAGGVGAVTSDRGNLPLCRLAIRAEVHQLTCATVVEQVFRNCHDEFLEATYIFPLPGRHAVTSCVMKFGDRTVEAILKERGEARAEYDRAIEEGKRASIAEEERSEVFTIRVGNIPPGEEVAITLTLAGPIPVVAGEATLRIPLVVAPRYVPGEPLDGASVGTGVAVDTDQAPDASRITPPTLLPGCPNPIDLQLEVELDPAGLAPTAEWRRQITCSLHSVIISDDEPCVIRMLPGERVNRDFILRFPVLPESPQCGAIWSVDDDGLATVGVTITPPTDIESDAAPRDVCVVLDRSGSMGGWKMVAARRAAGRLVESLGDNDRFRLVAFDNTIEQFAGDWAYANDQQRWQATQWLAGVEARGGTELGGALKYALKSFATSGAAAVRAPIVIVVTDGQVANEDGILKSLADHGLNGPRVFSVGIDRAVNAGFLTRLAELGRGQFELVESEDRLDEVLERFQRELGAPVLSHVEVRPAFGEFRGPLAPARAPDVFADRPVLMFGRVDWELQESHAALEAQSSSSNEPTLNLVVTARTPNGSAWERTVEARRVAWNDTFTTGKSALHAMWGRARVRDLEDQFASGLESSETLQKQIVATSLASGVLSRFTAFVAVDHSEVVNAEGKQHQVTQAVDMPEGWLGAVSMEQAQSQGMMSRLGNRLFRAAFGDVRGRVREFKKRGSGSESGRQCSPPTDSMMQEFTDTAIDFTETMDESFGMFESDAPVKKLVDLMLREAVHLNTSHIGLMVEGDVIRVLMVIDGAVRERDTPPSRLMSAIVSRLIILAKMLLERKDVPQHGVFDAHVRDVTAAVRAYSIPSDASPLLLLRFPNQRNRLPDPLPPEVQQWWECTVPWEKSEDESVRETVEMLRADLKT